MRFVRFAATFAVAIFVMGLWASSSQAVTRSLTGNARFQIGNGLPIPIDLQAPPNGKVFATPAATVMATAAKITFPTGVLTHPGTKATQGVFLANSAIFQVATALAVSFPAPGGAGALSAGGRTGGAVVSWCPGAVVGVPGVCAGFPAGGIIPGGIRYTATGAQFGGALRGTTAGTVTVALRVAGTPGMGKVTAVNAFASPMGLAAFGGAFNTKISTVAKVPVSPSGVFVGTPNALGSFTAGATPVPGGGAGNGATSYGAPWTTGRITVSNLAAVPVETFVLSGSDFRNASGAGPISLVSGTISARVLSGPNGNRGWLNLVLDSTGAAAVPAVPPGALAAGAGLLALAGSYFLRRKQAGSVA